MPNKNSDLHGSAPDKSEMALLLIDLINDFEFPEGDQLLQFALPMAERLAKLADRARAAGVPVVYANDNFGRWRSDFGAQVEHCLSDGVRGEPIVRKLRPKPEDYFVVKPKHSAFFETPLDTLLKYLGVKTVVVAGVATNICVLFTANDAYMHDLGLIVPSDGTAANTEEDHRYALEQMRTVLKAEVVPVDKIKLKKGAAN
ncbi:MAG: isochorismatase family cysteine hydrolase [Pirellulales bacterium]